jgi:NADP-reducing hydrogenase subunit HndB
MPKLKSLDDLKRVREEAQGTLKTRLDTGTTITVGMGTCGIAAGARDAMKAILDAIEKDQIAGVLVTQTGCIGLCEFEPIVDVQVGETPKVTYGKVSPERARAIVTEHVVGGKPIKEWMITR